MSPSVVFNALALRPAGSGVQTYIRQLLAHLPEAAPDVQWRAVVQADAAESLPPGIQPSVRPVASRVRRAVEGLRSLGPAELVHGLDVDLPWRKGAPSVITVHDLSVFDLAWTTDRLRATGERWLLRRALRRADAVISVSAFTAERLHQRFGVTADVTRLASDEALTPAPPDEVEDIRQRRQLPHQFVLYVGNIDPRKNIDLLADACRAAGLPLVVAGGRWGAGRVPAGAHELGYVPSAELAALYGAATIFAFPSHYEGFGLPPLEAMSCGVPVLVSRIPAHREVLGDAASYAGPTDAEEWTRQLRELAADADRRASMSAAGRAHAAQYRWSDTAASTVAVYRRLGL